MNIRMIALDSMIPNLALMQYSAWLKSQGHNVSLYQRSPDKVIISCIFKKNYNKAMHLSNLFKNKGMDTEIGGSGINLKSYLPSEAHKIMPDYSLYNNQICTHCGKIYSYCKCRLKNRTKGDIDYSMGFTTRGCIRKCDFCIVRQKEGKYQIWQHPKEFYNPEFKKIYLMDNNIYADKKWFFKSRYISRYGYKITYSRNRKTIK